ncbi:MAG: flagellar hook-length control protein FliK [Desulfurivibrionaceae bacterium]|nr:flagellar hook-length control protein FliK [Desulfurivibrionaceae bacterium]
MQITDLFSHIQKGGSATEAGRAARLVKPGQPVGHAGGLNLAPGQLLQGEVVGKDASGLLLLKLEGEIIAARTTVKIEPGQQFWFEVKEAGDTPLLNLARQKGAVQELLKVVMATRRLLVASPSDRAPLSSAPGAAVPASAEGGRPASAAGPAAGQVASAPSSGQGLPAQAVVAADGSLPPEAARLVRALVSSMDQLPGTGPAAGRQEAPPQPPLIKTLVSLIREGQIPASLQKIEAFQNVVQTRPSSAPPLPPQRQVPEAAGAKGGFPSPAPGAASASGPLQAPSPPGAGLSPPTAFLSPETIKVLNALVAVAGIKAPLAGADAALQPALQPDRNLAQILTMITEEGKIPPALQRLSPFLELMGRSPLPESLNADQKQPGLSGKTDTPAPALVALQSGAARQGAEPLPAQLRLLSSLLGLGRQEGAMEGRPEGEELFGRQAATEMTAETRKLAAFFEAHGRVNMEAAPQRQGDFYIIPAIFSNQAGWGEWLWSREGSPDDKEGPGQENLVFFLEMSNLGPLTIKVNLQGKKLSGQIIMADKEGSAVVAALLPELRERLQAIGYDVVDFPCSCQPLNLMQELKESLHHQAGSKPVSLLDVQA